LTLQQILPLALGGKSDRISTLARPTNNATRRYFPGADFIVQIGMEWSGVEWSDDRHAYSKPPLDPFRRRQRDDRRALLLNHDASAYGAASHSVATIIQMAL